MSIINCEETNVVYLLNTENEDRYWINCFSLSSTMEQKNSYSTNKLDSLQNTYSPNAFSAIVKNTRAEYQSNICIII